MDSAQRHAAYTETISPTGFYDPAAAGRLTHTEVPSPMLQLIDAFHSSRSMTQQTDWTVSVAEARGTLDKLLATSTVRAQLPLTNGTADVIEFSPQGPILKARAKRGNGQFQAHAR